jgi:sugar lactone lactonase YvrE
MLKMSNVALKNHAAQRLATALLCTVLAACGGNGGVTVDANRSELPAPVVAGVSESDLNMPMGITRDADGNLYVVDSHNHTIRKVTANGAITTIAGTPGMSGSADGAGTAARFNDPSNIAIDGARNLYVTDTGNHIIRKITPAGVVSTLAGTAGSKGNADGIGAAAQFNQPWGIAADAAGNVYVADAENYLIRKIEPSGAVTTFAGTRGARGNADGTVASATFRGPRGIAFDGAGNLYVTDWYGPPAPAFAETSTIIRKIAPNGEVSTLAGNTGDFGVNPVFRDTWAITVDAAGNVYVAARQSIRKITATGAVSTLADSAQFSVLQGATIDAAGNLYVADESRNIIGKVTQSGEVSIIAGNTN